MEPRYNDGLRDRFNEVSLYRGSFPYILLLRERRISFCIPRTSLYRGSLNRGSTVLGSLRRRRSVLKQDGTHRFPKFLLRSLFARTNFFAMCCLVQDAMKEEIPEHFDVFRSTMSQQHRVPL